MELSISLLTTAAPEGFSKLLLMMIVDNYVDNFFGRRHKYMHKSRIFASILVLTKKTTIMEIKSIEKRILEHVENWYQPVSGRVVYNDYYNWQHDGRDKCCYIVCIMFEDVQFYLFDGKMFKTDSIITQFFTRTEIIEAILHEFYN